MEIARRFYVVNDSQINIKNISGDITIFSMQLWMTLKLLSEISHNQVCDFCRCCEWLSNLYQKHTSSAPPAWCPRCELLSNLYQKHSGRYLYGPWIRCELLSNLYQKHIGENTDGCGHCCELLSNLYQKHSRRYLAGSRVCCELLSNLYQKHKRMVKDLILWCLQTQQLW